MLFCSEIMKRREASWCSQHGVGLGQALSSVLDRRYPKAAGAAPGKEAGYSSEVQRRFNQVQTM